MATFSRLATVQSKKQLEKKETQLDQVNLISVLREGRVNQHVVFINRQVLLLTVETVLSPSSKEKHTSMGG